MTPGSCALCLDGHKSQLYGGPRQGRPETRAPTFSLFLTPIAEQYLDPVTGEGGERGRGGSGQQVWPLSQMMTGGARGLGLVS